MNISILVILILIFIATITHLINRKLYSPVFIFCVCWIINLTLSNIDINARGITSNYIYFIILIGCLSYILGSIFYSLISRNKLSEVMNYECQERQFSIQRYEKRVKIINIILIISLLWLSYRVIYAIMTTSISSYVDMRKSFYNEDIILRSVFDKYFNKYVIQSLVYFNIVYISTFLFSPFKSNITKKNLMYSIINVVWYTILYGGRGFIFYLFLVNIVGYLINIKTLVYKLNSYKIRKNKKKIIIFSVVGVFFLVFMSFIRKSSGNHLSLVENVIIYVSNSSRYFEVLLNTVELNEFNFAFISGLLEFFAHINSIIGVELIPAYATKIAAATTEMINFSPTVAYNAFPTAYYSFMFDYGLWGVFINSMLFGFISQHLYTRMMCCTTGIRHKMQFLLLMCIIFEFPLRWSGLYTWPYAVWMIIIWLTSRKRYYFKY